MIFNSSYDQIATVKAGKRAQRRLHEFLITPRARRLITAYYPMYVDATSIHGSKRQIVPTRIVPGD